MKFIHVLLIVYFVLVAGGALTLWQSGVLSRVDPLWTVIAASVAIGLGILATITATPTPVTTEEPPPVR